VKDKMPKHIVVLKGGRSAEREVSLVSGAGCAKALAELGYNVTELDAAIENFAGELSRLKPALVFNALHGKYGEDGCVQGLLEIMQIPYTHSGVLASAVAMDKPLAKIIFERFGLKVPFGKTISSEDLQKGEPLPRPFVLKPAAEGSSVGVEIFKVQDNKSVGHGSWVMGHEESLYLVEEYIEGRELTVAVLNGKPLGVTEIRPKSGFYNYENKYTDGKTEHICPAPLSAEESQNVMEMAVIAHNALGCKGLTRSDFRYDGKDFYILEINTQPGMTPLSLSPEQAQAAGISYNQLVEKIVQSAGLNG